MMHKLMIYGFVLIVGGGYALWEKFDEWRHPDKKRDPVDTNNSKPLIITQGAAGCFIESEPFYSPPGSKEYDEIQDAAIFYPQTREGAEAFLTAMAKERNASWVSTTVVGVAKDDAGRAKRNEGTLLMRPLEVVSLFSKEEDCDYEDDETREASFPGSDDSWVIVEFIDYRLGMLEPVLGAEIVQAKEDDNARMLAFVLEITGTSEEDRGIDLGILRWEAKDETEEA